MTQPTTTKPEVLSRGQQLENVLFGCATCTSIGLLAAVWTARMWLRSYRKWRKKHLAQWFRPQLTKVIDVWVIGKQNRAYLIRDILKAYHIRNFVFSYHWNVQDRHVGVSVKLLVNPSLYDQVDSILFNNAQGNFDVQSAPGSLRHVQFRPHDQVAKTARRPSQRHARPAQRPTALGKTYQ